MSEPPEIKGLIEKEMGFLIPTSTTGLEELKTVLSKKFRDLINNDFNGLVQILYRVDIDETKLKNILKENKDKDTADLLAELTIERQLQKINSRQRNKPDENISDDEKW